MTSAVNVIMNVIMVQFWGLYGIILSTVLSVLTVSLPWLFHNLFTTVFRSGRRELFLKISAYGIVSAVSCAICIGISRFVSFDSLILTLALRLVICTVISNVNFLGDFLQERRIQSTVATVNSVTKGKNKFLKKTHVGFNK